MGSTPVLAERLGVGFPRGFWLLWRVSCWALVLVQLLTLWQGFAEHSRLPAGWVLGLQLCLIGTWVNASAVIIVACERRCRALLSPGYG